MDAAVGMNQVVEENLALLQQRWPQLYTRITTALFDYPLEWITHTPATSLAVNGYRLWSAFNPEAEGELQATPVPDTATEAWVYGIGSGDLIRALLRRDDLKQLHVVILNPGLAHLLMHSLDHRDWLQDPRVELLDAAGQTLPQSPFAVVPACLHLCTDETVALRDQLLLELNTPFERQRQQGREPLRQKRIEQNRSLITSDGDVDALFGSAQGSSIAVVIAGPTLAQTADWLQSNRNEGPVIAVDGALSPLLKKNIVPDLVVSVDDNEEWIVKYFSGDLAACKNSTLVYAPVVPHAALLLWPGRRLTMYTSEARYDKLRQQIPKGKLFLSGSVSHAAVDLAVKMGARQVRLFGADFGFPGDQIHANPDGPVEFYDNAARAGATVKNGHGQMIRTLPSFNGYRLDLEQYIAHIPDITFINMSRNGACIRGTVYPDEGSA